MADVVAGEPAGRLLAAAPELLDECRRALAALEQAGQASVDAARLRALIAKATGG